MTMISLQKRWNKWIGSKKNAGDDEAVSKINSAQIIYVFGPSGTGKSFSGDYLDVVHGYHHVDGDIPLKHIAVVPEYKEIMEKQVIDGDWAPHFSEIARLTVEAAKNHEKVVVSHATEKNEYRDHVIQKLVEGGVNEDNITLIQLTIDMKVKARGMYHRTKRQVEQAGMTLTDACRMSWQFEGEMKEDKFIQLYIEDQAKHEAPFDTHPKSVIVDVSGRDVTHFDNLDKALGLARSSDLTYDDICAKVKPIDEARDKETMANGYAEAMAEVFAKAAAKAGDNSLVINEEGEDEEKVEEMKKRRSSLVQLEQSMRSLSVQDTSEGIEIRRKSLIKTGTVVTE